MKLTIKMKDERERFADIPSMHIGATITYKDGTTEFSNHFFVDNVSELEDLESELEQIAYQIRDFRMKNFPESKEIEE